MPQIGQCPGAGRRICGCIGHTYTVPPGFSVSDSGALIYRDRDLIKRAIRDLYHRDIDEVVVEGDEGYKAAKGFMKLLMPSHVRRVKQYAGPTPIFQRFGDLPVQLLPGISQQTAIRCFLH